MKKRFFLLFAIKSYFKKTQRKMLNIKKAIFILSSIGAVGCAPKVYVIDRQTVLQEQAAGEWPDFEESLTVNLKKKNPVMLPKSSTNETEKNQKLYKVLNAEMETK